MKKHNFSGKTLLERLNKDEYVLRSTLKYEDDRIKISVKNGLKTDGLSAPRWLWILAGCPFSGSYVGTAIIHDGLYRSHILSQKDSDIIFERMLKSNGTGYFRRNIMYYLLRIFGIFAYNSKSDQTILENKQYISIKIK